MTSSLIVGIALAILGLLLVLAWRLPENIRPSKKKKLRVSELPADKDWKGSAERFEKRVKAMELELQSFQYQLRDKDKIVEQMKVAAIDLQKQLEQGKIWMVKEEAGRKKEKQQELSLKAELLKARESLNREVSERINNERELKDFRLMKDELSGANRSLSARVIDLERQLESLMLELKQLRNENAQLCKKKEDTEWVAKSDYKQLELDLKRVRAELAELKKSEAV